MGLSRRLLGGTTRDAGWASVLIVEGGQEMYPSVSRKAYQGGQWWL